MFILLTIGLFLLKFLAVGVVGLFFIEDLELIKSNIGFNSSYSVYLALACITFFALFFFILGKKFLWLIVFIVCGSMYLGMYNSGDIKKVHQENDLRSRYFKDTGTFCARMIDVINAFSKKETN